MNLAPLRSKLGFKMTLYSCLLRWFSLVIRLGEWGFSSRNILRMKLAGYTPKESDFTSWFSSRSVRRFGNSLRAIEWRKRSVQLISSYPRLIWRVYLEKRDFYWTTRVTVKKFMRARDNWNRMVEEKFGSHSFHYRIMTSKWTEIQSCNLPGVKNWEDTLRTSPSIQRVGDRGGSLSFSSTLLRTRLSALFFQNYNKFLLLISSPSNDYALCCWQIVQPPAIIRRSSEGYLFLWPHSAGSTLGLKSPPFCQLNPSLCVWYAWTESSTEPLLPSE
jgi:hypothetical protein